MVAAGFSGGEADSLRRAITNWGRNSKLLTFEHKLKSGMLARGYSAEFAEQLFSQIKGFGGYGFPESHSASFALLAYVSAWLKCHHPAAFYVGLLNSQPMGFYTPSQLIQDARRHRVEVLPVDINHSDWDHSLLAQSPTPKGCIRLGLRIIKRLSRAGAERIVDARKHRPFSSLNDLKKRCHLDRDDLEALSAADSLFQLGGHRYQSHWDIMALQDSTPLLSESNETPTVRDNISAPSAIDNVLFDYQSTGLSLKQHPMALLREQDLFQRCKRQSELITMGNRRFVRTAGIVTCRQRPGTASGVVFLTLEDETGNINVVVWPSVQEQFRAALMTSQLMMIKGTVESRDGVTHVIASALYDHSHALNDLAVKSRDFH